MNETLFDRLLLVWAGQTGATPDAVRDALADALAGLLPAMADFMERNGYPDRDDQAEGDAKRGIFYPGEPTP